VPIPRPAESLPRRSEEAPLLQPSDERRLSELTAELLAKLGSPFEGPVDLLLLVVPVVGKGGVDLP